MNSETCSGSLHSSKKEAPPSSTGRPTARKHEQHKRSVIKSYMNYYKKKENNEQSNIPKDVQDKNCSPNIYNKVKELPHPDVFSLFLLLSTTKNLGLNI